MPEFTDASLVLEVDVAISSYLERDCKGASQIAVALSGGRDSVVLLHALQRQLSSCNTVRCFAVHVNHGLSQYAEEWVQFCKTLCTNYSVELVVIPVVVDKKNGFGSESDARSARYEAFSSLEAEHLLLGHHQSDQAETLLFNLIRGAGVRGASAIPRSRGITNGPRIFRPLLAVSRDAINAYAQRWNLSWVEDDSNENVRYSRNYLRNQIFPKLKQRFPSVESALAKAANNFFEASVLLNDLAKIDRSQCLGENFRIDISKYKSLSFARAKNLLQYEWSLSGERPLEAAHLEEAVRQLLTSSPDRAISVGIRGTQIRTYRQHLYITQEISPEPQRFVWRGDAVIPWGNTSIAATRTVGRGVSVKTLTGQYCEIRHRHGGEMFNYDQSRPTKSLKKIFQEQGVPPWLRSTMPLLVINGDIVWVPYVGVNTAYQCPQGDDGVMFHWSEDSSEQESTN